jgi:hypothetical protein
MLFMTCKSDSQRDESSETAGAAVTCLAAITALASLAPPMLATLSLTARAAVCDSGQTMRASSDML